MSDEPIEIPINGVLDLHTFSPKDVKELVPGFLDACREKGICRVRIIHGKGKGILRDTVHSVLRTLPYVTDFRLGGDGAGGWGATIVALRAQPGREQ